MEMKWKVPAQTSCDNSSGQKVIAVPSCVPAPVCSKCGNTLGCVSCYNETANETREYRHHVLCSGDRRFPAGDPGHSCSCFELKPPPAERMFTVEQMREVGRKFQWEHTVEKIIAALDPPKPKMPEKSVEVFSMGVNIEGCERVWVVLVDKNPNHPLSCYGLREDVAKAYGSTLRAELAKERL